MCGRVVAARPLDDLVAHFGVDDVVAPPLPARYNVAPTAALYAVVDTRRGRRLGTMSWGLVPSWSADPSSGPRPINARAETLLERPLFAEAAARRRLLCPVDGFYEWRKLPTGGRQPHYITWVNGAPLGWLPCGIAGSAPAPIELCGGDHRGQRRRRTASRSDAGAAATGGMGPLAGHDPH